MTPTGSGSSPCQKGAWANIPPKRNRKEPICFSPYLYRARNLVERFFSGETLAVRFGNNRGSSLEPSSELSTLLESARCCQLVGSVDFPQTEADDAARPRNSFRYRYLGGAAHSSPGSSLFAPGSSLARVGRDYVRHAGVL